MNNTTNNNACENNNIAQIRQGFVQYIGALSENISLTSKLNSVKANKQMLVAIVLEELLKIADNDLFIAKPFLRASNYLLNGRINNLNKLKDIGLDQKTQASIMNEIADINAIQNKLNTLIDTIKE